MAHKATAQWTPKLLIVDDEAANLELLQRIFMRDHAVTPARNGKEALQAIASQDYDLVLLDIMMPVLGGIDALQIIRETPQSADLPVILISALSDSEQIAFGLKLGANDYITKPFDVNVIRARVSTQLKLKRLMDERKNTIEQLETANRIKERLMQVASHDLRSPLTNLRMLHRLLFKVTGDNPRVHDLVQRGDTIIDTMLTVITSFLDNETDISTMQINMRPVMPVEIVEDVLGQYVAAAQSKRISLRPDDLNNVPIVADPDRLAQVISNLLSNAIKYSPPNSQIHVYSETAGNFWRLSVADEGPGIRADERDKLFQPFKRLSNQPTGGETSSGLGLWIVKQMMELQGGAVSVLCPPQGGSIFWIELPLADAGAGVG